MNKAVLAGISAVFIAVSHAAYADIEYWKVVEVTGAAQIKAPLESDWKDLSAPFFLKRGSFVRTAKGGSVDLCLNRQWDSFLRLNENSEAEFPDKPENTVRLKNGLLFVLLEDERSADFLNILSPDAAMRLSSGGLSLAAAPSGEALRVFGESVRIEGVSEPVGEGWEWAAGRTRRMDFSDYSDWQRWVRKNYDRKDNYFRKRSL